MKDRNKNTLTNKSIGKENLRFSPPPQIAAGMRAVLSSLKHSLREMGPLRTTQTLLKVNQKKGFDCPGCAWPDPDDRRSMVEFCENGAKAVADEATLKKITPEFFHAHSISELKSKSDHWLNQQGRLTTPLWRPAGSDHYEEISWEQAFDLIVRELRQLSSPHEAVFYTSGRTSNEAAFLYQLMVRLFGTNNLPDCSNMCHESSGVALTEVIGSGKGTVTLEDFDQADLIMVIGQNPGTNHPRMLSTLQQAKEKGAKIISINPLPETGMVAFQHPQRPLELLGARKTVLTDLFLQVKINGDVALLKGLMKKILEEEALHPGEVLDHEFIRQHTTGFEEYQKDLELVPWSEIVELSGIPKDLIEKAAALYIQSQRTICCWAMGLTQHKNAVGNIQEVINLLLLKGNLGRPGAGACPVRGHSNVQGDRTMGINERPPQAFLNLLAQEFHFTPPSSHGYNVVETLKAMEESKVKVFVSMGGNFISATPDTGFTTQIIKNCELTVQISTKLNRSHLETGKVALILPCLGRTEIDMQEEGEQFVTVEDSMGVIHPSQGHLPPASSLLKSEPAIVAHLALKLFAYDPLKGPHKGSKVDWKKLASNYDHIRDHISRCIPGFEDFNQRLRTPLFPQSFYLPHPVRDGRKFLTTSNKAQFTLNPLPRIQLRQDEYLMMTIRSHDQYNTTIYGLDDRYRGVFGGRRVVFMNREDMEKIGLKKGDSVILESCYDDPDQRQMQTRRTSPFRVVPYDIPSQNVATYFPEANELIPYNQYADKSHTPISKSIVIKLLRCP